MICTNCYEKTLERVGVAFDDGVSLGWSYECTTCGHSHSQANLEADYDERDIEYEPDEWPVLE